MEFYSSISRNYEYIFPLNSFQVDFIRSFTNKGSAILDIGCGVGLLSIELARKGYHSEGIDFDPEMISMSKNKANDLTISTPPVFRQMDMLMLDENYPSNHFDGITCFGNTLVHLSGADDIMKFLKGAHSILKPEGTLMIQILNYDNILDNKIDRLADIDNEHILFERFYEFNDNGTIEFITKLFIKKSGEHIENRIELYPVRKGDLTNILTEAGFDNIEFFGSFKKDELKKNSIPLVIKAVKKQ